MGYLKYLWIFLLLIPLESCKEGERRESDDGRLFGNMQNEFPMFAGVSGSLSKDAMLVNTGARNLLPAFTLLYDDLLQIPEAGISLCSSLVEASLKPEALLYHSFRMLGAPAGGKGPPLAGTGIEQRPLEFAFCDGGEENWELLPGEFKKGLREALQGWMVAELVLKEFLAAVGNERQMESLMEPWRDRELDNFESIDLIEKADLRKLSFASRLMASSLTSLTSLAGLMPGGAPDEFDQCILETKIGRVGIFGTKRDTLKSGYALLIDLGGDDLYQGHIASPQRGGSSIAIVIDFAGNDTYEAGDGYLVNGCLGIGMLFDLAGNDCYYTESQGLASSCYGTSMLYDRMGDDLYRSSSDFSQGAAHVGSALLIDLDGDDEYSSSGSSQGYGGTLGLGLLMDLAGNDIYNEGQSSSSFVQGAGRGRWAEASDGHSLGGGLGIFIEAGGADQYYAQSFSQGASYFTGMGLFFDLGGDDQYTARSHSQAYAAHFGLAGFFELKGDDRYNAGADFNKITQLLGSGRDLSAGWFIEADGDDTYHLGNRSCGIGDFNGVGILWDRKGNDTYIWHQNSINAGSPSLGQVFTVPEGMSRGVRMGSFPAGKETGQFRDEKKGKTVIVKNE